MTPGWPRLALRLRTLVIALGIGMILAISCLGIGSASAATRARLAVSLNPDRSSAVRLGGSTVKERSTSSSGTHAIWRRSTFTWTTRRVRSRRFEPIGGLPSTSPAPHATARHGRTTPQSLPMERTASGSY